LDDKRDAQPLDDHYRRTKRDRATDSLDDAMAVVENKESSAKRPDEQSASRRVERPGAICAHQALPELREAVVLRDLQQLNMARSKGSPVPEER